MPKVVQVGEELGELGVSEVSVSVSPERLEKRCSTLNDADLVFVMLGILQPSMSGHPVTAGASVTAGKCARVAFTEIAQRWIPLDVFAEAFMRLDIEEEADDAS